MSFLSLIDKLRKMPHLPAKAESWMINRTRQNITQISSSADIKSYPTIWVDVSVISKHDAETGIQRVVRALFSELQLSPPTGWRIQPVAGTRKHAYQAVKWKVRSNEVEQCGDINVRPGDIFLGLDLSAHVIPNQQRQLAEWKAQGMKITFLVYDLLPLQYPHWFSAKLVGAFRRWARCVAMFADTVFCISEPVADDFNALLQSRYNLQASSIKTHVIPLGADIKSSEPSTGLPLAFEAILEHLGTYKSALMVGTIEPRKGYAQVLDAFEELWEKGATHSLVIVGKPGWMTQKLQDRLQNNPHLNTRLFWLSNASDEALDTLYRCCSGVIVASYAEGFGLPLLEAIGHGKPVLARDLKVFRQFDTTLVEYVKFPSEPETAAEHIHQWISSLEKKHLDNTCKLTDAIPTWGDSLNCILSSLLPEAESALKTPKWRTV